MTRLLPLAAIALCATTNPVDRHIELVESVPAADAVLSTPPTELVLTFSADLDYERSAVTLRGPGGSVKLSNRQESDNPRVLSVTIEGELRDGPYTVSWTAAPTDDHGGRGRFGFQIGSGNAAAD